MIVNVNTTSKKPTKTALDYEDFISMVNNRVKSLEFDWCSKNKTFEIPTKIRNQFEKQVSKDIESRFRVKGSRSGHINKASAELQEKYNSLKDQLSEIKFSVDGVDYVCNAICKKAPTSEEVTK